MLEEVLENELHPLDCRRKSHSSPSPEIQSSIIQQRQQIVYMVPDKVMNTSKLLQGIT